MASHPCVLSRCRHCRQGRLCAESARWEADEDYFEEKDANADAFYQQMWTRRSEPHTYFDVDDPYPHTSSGVLRDDPAMDWR